MGTHARFGIFGAAERTADSVDTDQMERARAWFEDGRLSHRQRAAASKEVVRFMGAVAGDERTLST